MNEMGLVKSQKQISSWEKDFSNISNFLECKKVIGREEKKLMKEAAESLRNIVNRIKKSKKSNSATIELLKEVLPPSLHFLLG